MAEASTFGKWISSNGKAFLGTGVVSSALMIASSSDHVWGVLGTLRVFKYPLLWIYALNILLTAFVLLWSTPWRGAYKSIKDLADDDPTKVTMLNLQMWWRILITAWGVGYALYFIQALLDTMKGPDTAKAPVLIPGWVLVITMKFEIASFLGLYFALSRSRTNQIGDAWTWTFVSFILFLLTCIEVLIEALAATGTYRGTVANAISCAILGVAISMFVGRLDSRRIAIHPLVLFCCYAYAAIQPIYPLASKDFVLFLYAATLFFKVVMVAYVTYLVGNRLMLGYVEMNNSDPNTPPTSPSVGPTELEIPSIPIGLATAIAQGEQVPQKIIVQDTGPGLFH